MSTETQRRPLPGGPNWGAPPLPPNALWPGPPAPDNPDEAWRCATCAIDWPNDSRLFQLPGNGRWWNDDPTQGPPCPVCHGETVFAANFAPISMAEAWSLKNHADFERFYERRGPREVLTREELEQYG